MIKRMFGWSEALLVDLLALAQALIRQMLIPRKLRPTQILAYLNVIVKFHFEEILVW
jgi:hypothetical protein